MVAGAESMSSGKICVKTWAARAGMEWKSMAYTVLLQTEMDKSFETGNLFWTVMKGICYGKAAQAV
jgi:hypothetical protein